jgi:hypothetical protein
MPNAMIAIGSDVRPSQRHSTFRSTRFTRIKDAFLGALVVAGDARVYMFATTSHSLEVGCGCGRSWCGRGHCYRCGEEGDPVPVEMRWYVVEARGYRFHLPT